MLPFFQIGYSSRNRMFLQFKACMATRVLIRQ
jgi:hypothetical protein